MGTRAILVLKFQGKYYVLWNQFDGGPGELGNELLIEMNSEMYVDYIKLLIPFMKKVNPEDKPTLEEKRKTVGYYKGTLTGRDRDENELIRSENTTWWHILGREHRSYLRAARFGYYLDDSEFLEKDGSLSPPSPWIFFQYVLDLDLNAFTGYSTPINSPPIPIYQFDVRFPPVCIKEFVDEENEESESIWKLEWYHWFNLSYKIPKNIYARRNFRKRKPFIYYFDISFHFF